MLRGYWHCMSLNWLSYGLKNSAITEKESNPHLGRTKGACLPFTRRRPTRQGRLRGIAGRGRITETKPTLPAVLARRIPRHGRRGTRATLSGSTLRCPEPDELIRSGLVGGLNVAVNSICSRAQRPGRDGCGMEVAQGLLVRLLTSNGVDTKPLSDQAVDHVQKPREPLPASLLGVRGEKLAGVFEHEEPPFSDGRFLVLLVVLGSVEENVEHVRRARAEERLGVGHVVHIAPRAPFPSESPQCKRLAGAGRSVPRAADARRGFGLKNSLAQQTTELAGDITGVVVEHLGPGRHFDPANGLSRPMRSERPERHRNPLLLAGLRLRVALAEPGTGGRRA